MTMHAHDYKSIINVSMIFAGQQKNTSMLVKKHLFTCCPAANLALQTCEKKKQWIFYGTARASTLAPEIISLAQVSCKSFRSCRNYNSLYVNNYKFGVVCYYNTVIREHNPDSVCITHTCIQTILITNLQPIIAQWQHYH